MQSIKNRKFNCYNLSKIGDNNVIDWSKANASDNLVINVCLYRTLELSFTQ